MTRETLLNVLRFVLLLIIQGLILSNVVLWEGKAQVYLYVLFIIMLPLRTHTMLAMVLGFILGLGVDMFYDSPGLHASSAVVVAFVRPYFVRLLTPRDDYDINDRPNISSMGLIWFVKLTTAMLFIHAFWIFFLEAFSFSGFGFTFLKALATALISLVVSLISVYLFTRKPT
jgi:hypothetical protein